MKRVRDTSVTLAPRGTMPSLFTAPDLRSALDRARASATSDGTRLAIWLDSPAPGQGPDVVVCVPVTAFESRRTHAEDILARWDAMWLLIESMPRRHRDMARQHLVDEISIALLASAIEGVEEPFSGGYEELDL